MHCYSNAPYRIRETEGLLRASFPDINCKFHNEPRLSRDMVSWCNNSVIMFFFDSRRPLEIKILEFSRMHWFVPMCVDAKLDVGERANVQRQRI